MSANRHTSHNQHSLRCHTMSASAERKIASLRSSISQSADGIDNKPGPFSLGIMESSFRSFEPVAGLHANHPRSLTSHHLMDEVAKLREEVRGVKLEWNKERQYWLESDASRRQQILTLQDELRQQRKHFEEDIRELQMSIEEIGRSLPSTKRPSYRRPVASIELQRHASKRPRKDELSSVSDAHIGESPHSPPEREEREIATSHLLLQLAESSSDEAGSSPASNVNADKTDATQSLFAKQYPRVLEQAMPSPTWALHHTISSSYKQLANRDLKHGPSRSKRRRGHLPEESTTVLRDWLLQNKDRPYPSENEKDYFVETTGLTLIQINNWFSNARRRILKRHMPKSGETEQTANG